MKEKLKHDKMIVGSQKDAYKDDIDDLKVLVDKKKEIEQVRAALIA